MIAILVGLRMLRPCEVTAYTPDQFLVTTINEGNMDKWKREEWRRPHGKEIKNKELWQELSEQMEKHRVSLEFSKSTRYSDRLQSKMREKEENHEI
jgi:ribonuclease HI